MQPVPASRSNVFRRSSVALLALAVVLLMGAGDAWAKKKVAIIKFKGPQAAKVQKSVTAVIKSENSVVAASKVTKAQKKLKAKKLTSKNVKRLAAAVEADAIVSATIKKKKGKLSLTVTVYEGASGQVVGDVPVTFKKLNDDAMQQIAEGVLPLIAQVAEGAGGGEEVAEGGPPPEEAAPPEEQAPPEETAPSPEETAAAGGIGMGGGEGGDGEKKDGEEGEGGDGADSGEPATADGKWAREWSVDVMAGMSFIGRKINFNYQEGVDMEPWGYNGNPVPGFFVAADAYPLSFGGKKGVLANLGVGFMFDRVLSLKSKLRSGTDEFTTTQQRMGLELLYRWNLGAKTTSPTLRFALGYQAITFSIDAMDLDLPNAAYSMLYPGAGIRFPIGSGKLALFADLKYLLVSSAGAMNEMANYGKASMNGLDFGGGLEFRVFTRMPIKVGAQYTRIGYSFDGSGAKTNRDGDPEQDVSGASDTYFGGYVQAGYLF